MLESYSTENGSTRAQREAVGLLLYHLGIAVNMAYGEDVSTAGTSTMAGVFDEHFRTSGEYVWATDPDFYVRLYSNIVYQRPVQLAIDGAEAIGHVVVVDGVQHNLDDTKYFHLNFGWQGSADAWYDIDSDIEASTDTYKSIDGAVMDVLPSPILNSDSGATSAGGNYTLSWDVSTRLNADYYELMEGMPTILTFLDGAEDGTNNWLISGNWEPTTVQRRSGEQSFKVFGPYGGIFGTNKIISNEPFYIDESTSITYYWKTSDFALGKVDFQVSTDRALWHTLKTYAEENQNWDLEDRIDLSDYVGETIFVRFESDHLEGVESAEVSASGETGFFFDDFTVNNYRKISWSTLDDHILSTEKSISGKSNGTFHYKVRSYRYLQWWAWSNVYDITVEPTTEIRSLDLADVPEGFSLSQNYPNPFNPATIIRYDMVKANTVQLSVYALNGQLVRTLENQERPAGTYFTTWDGKDGAGRALASGLYLYRLQAGQQVKTRKLILLR